MNNFMKGFLKPFTWGNGLIGTMLVWIGICVWLLAPIGPNLIGAPFVLLYWMATDKYFSDLAKKYKEEEKNERT